MHPDQSVVKGGAQADGGAFLMGDPVRFVDDMGHGAERDLHSPHSGLRNRARLLQVALQQLPGTGAPFPSAAATSVDVVPEGFEGFEGELTAPVAARPQIIRPLMPAAAPCGCTDIQPRVVAYIGDTNTKTVPLYEMWKAGVLSEGAS